MKITILQGAFLPVPAIQGGAIEKAWEVLGQAFAVAGHNVTHISKRHSEFPDSEYIGAVHHLRVRGFKSVQNPYLLKLKEFLYVLKVRSILPPADILVTHTFWAPLLLPQKKYGKIFVHVGRYPKGQLKFYTKASRFQVPTSAIARAVENEVPNRSDDICILPYPFSWKIDCNSEYSKRPKTILYLGRIHAEKGILALVNAFKNIPLADRKGWKLLIRGPWRAEQGGGGENYLSKINNAIQDCGSQIEIQEPTFSSVELKNELEKARLFVYPSLAEKGETFGLAVLEAMSCGCVPLVSSLECFQDLIVENENGYIFDHRSKDLVRSLSLTLLKSMQGTNQNMVFSSRCLKKAKEFELDRLALQYIGDFTNLLSKKDS
ncbi:MAG: glycosyltransferase family 4 protein [Opitutae bacterium]|nr:glycosyltransferase family 4 protein [Opitutae bacterium]